MRFGFCINFYIIKCVSVVCVSFFQTTILIDWLIGTRCYSAEVGQNYSKKKVESVQDKQKVTAPNPLSCNVLPAVFSL